MKKFYVGTYTNGESEGIYRLLYDTDRIETSLAAVCESPSYLCLSQTQDVLYAVKEDTVGGKGSVMAYRITDNSFELMNQVDSLSQGLVHLVVNQDNTYLFTVSYEDAQIMMYRLNQDGSVGELTCQKKQEGHSIHPIRQTCAHAHSAWLTPDESYLCICDLGLDQMVVYEIDYTKGVLEEKSEWKVKFPEGSGPRHMVFHPQGDHAYLYSELSCRVYVMEYSVQTGFHIIQEEKIFTNFNVEEENDRVTGAAIRMSQDGKFLYTSNRGEDSITLFEVDQNGWIHKKNTISCEGKHPRDFNLSEDDTLLLCANRDSNDITIFERNIISGELSLIQTISNISMPIAIIEQP